MKIKEVLKDTGGKDSAKRLLGAIILTAALIFLLSLGYISIGTVVQDPETALKVGEILFWGGVALLTAGVIEKLGTKGK